LTRVLFIALRPPRSPLFPYTTLFRSLNPILRQKGICSLLGIPLIVEGQLIGVLHVGSLTRRTFNQRDLAVLELAAARAAPGIERDRKSTRLNSSHRTISYAVFCMTKK